MRKRKKNRGKGTVEKTNQNKKYIKKKQERWKIDEIKKNKNTKKG